LGDSEHVCVKKRASERGSVWRRLIGSPKLQIIFDKRATKYMSLLRKMTHKDKGSYESSPPCSVCVCVRVFRFMCVCGGQKAVDSSHRDKPL